MQPVEKALACVVVVAGGANVILEYQSNGLGAAIGTAVFMIFVIFGLLLVGYAFESR